MNAKKISAVVMAAMVAASSMVTTAFADTTISTIDTTKTGSITLHKLLENDGSNTEHDGLENPNETREALDDVVFSYKKIGDMVIVGGDSQVGIYFENLDKGFTDIAKDIGYDLSLNSNKTIIEGETYYTTKQVEDAVNYINANEGNGSSFTGETVLNDYLEDSGIAMPATDETGTTVVDNLGLGLYLIGETDITAHDGLDANGNLINQSPNPEAPVVESPASPFLACIPTTNISTIDGNVAGTVWIYDQDIYPKDSRGYLFKRIVDPDENGVKTLRTVEDYQIGDTISQVIYAGVPKIQPGKTHKKLEITDTMTAGLTFNRVTKVTYGPRVDDPTTDADLEDSLDTTLEAGKDYTVTPSKPADTVNGASTFKVTLTSAGLAKMDAITADSEIAVWFDCTLDKNAKIGTIPQNENHPSLTWRNSNTLERTINGNEVKVYTYELDITKKGLTDASKAKFTFKRYDTMNGAAADEFGTTASESDVAFVEEKAGTYHVFDAEHGDKEDQKVTELAPAKDGKLFVKGLDSNKYTIKEIATEDHKNLLKSTFDINLKAADPVRDGNFVKATVNTPDNDAPTDIAHENGVAKLTVNNYKTVTLRTGGEGRTIIYGSGIALLILIAAAYLLSKKKHVA